MSAAIPSISAHIPSSVLADGKTITSAQRGAGTSGFPSRKSARPRNPAIRPLRSSASAYVTRTTPFPALLWTSCDREIRATPCADTSANGCGTFGIGSFRSRIAHRIDNGAEPCRSRDCTLGSSAPLVLVAVGLVVATADAGDPTCNALYAAAGSLVKLRGMGPHHERYEDSEC